MMRDNTSLSELDNGLPLATPLTTHPLPVIYTVWIDRPPALVIPLATSEWDNTPPYHNEGPSLVLFLL